MAVRNRLLDLQSSEVMLVGMGWIQLQNFSSDWDCSLGGGGGEKLTAILHNGERGERFQTLACDIIRE